jgi:hypothetical protein
MSGGRLGKLRCAAKDVRSALAAIAAVKIRVGLRAAAEPIFRARITFQAFFNGESQIFTLRGNGTGTRRVSHATK